MPPGEGEKVRALTFARMSSRMRKILLEQWHFSSIHFSHKARSPPLAWRCECLAAGADATLRWMLRHTDESGPVIQAQVLNPSYGPKTLTSQGSEIGDFRLPTQEILFYLRQPHAWPQTCCNNCFGWSWTFDLLPSTSGVLKLKVYRTTLGEYGGGIKSSASCTLGKQSIDCSTS